MSSMVTFTASFFEYPMKPIGLRLWKRTRFKRLMSCGVKLLSPPTQRGIGLSLMTLKPSSCLYLMASQVTTTTRPSIRTMIESPASCIACTILSDAFRGCFSSHGRANAKPGGGLPLFGCGSKSSTAFPKASAITRPTARRGYAPETTRARLQQTLPSASQRSCTADACRFASSRSKRCTQASASAHAGATRTNFFGGWPVDADEPAFRFSLEDSSSADFCAAAFLGVLGSWTLKGNAIRVPRCADPSPSHSCFMLSNHAVSMLRSCGSREATASNLAHTSPNLRTIPAATSGASVPPCH
mmetsp:Transcript_47952/g.138796  ORF Transcript_47952/g.138796 Transcript_47952/m.138796 type:complete len:300 (+) Transcript_47952:206-1105(+)